jgi:hypothetical protein
MSVAGNRPIGELVAERDDAYEDAGAFVVEGLGDVDADEAPTPPRGGARICMREELVAADAAEEGGGDTLGVTCADEEELAPPPCVGTKERWS